MGAILYIIHITVAAFLIIIILLQQGKGSDMGAAFGGASSTVFGGASGRQSFLVKVTVGLATVFMLLALGLSFRASYIQRHGRLPSPIEEEGKTPVIPGAAAPATNFPAQPVPGEPGQLPEAPTAPVKK